MPEQIPKKDHPSTRQDIASSVVKLQHAIRKLLLANGVCTAKELDGADFEISVEDSDSKTEDRPNDAREFLERRN